MQPAVDPDRYREDRPQAFCRHRLVELVGDPGSAGVVVDRERAPERENLAAESLTDGGDQAVHASGAGSAHVAEPERRGPRLELGGEDHVEEVRVLDGAHRPRERRARRLLGGIGCHATSPRRNGPGRC